jgi:tight adherence protein B
VAGSVLTTAVLVALAIIVWPPRAGEGSRADAGHAGPPLGGPQSALLARWRVALAGRLRRRPRHPWVADLADVTAVGLDAGLDLTSAVLVAARSPSLVGAAPWLIDHLDESVEAGRGVAVLGDAAATITAQERRDLAMLEHAWQLAEQAGAATSVVTAAAASSIRARHAAAERAAVVAAGPLASMWLLSALPVAGPAAALLVGIGPGRLYATDAARVSALVGLLLAASGWWWSRALVRRAQRAGRTDGSVA